MVEEIDDSGFYREDFSTESDWEVFNAQLGEMFLNWGLSGNNCERPLNRNEIFQCKWHIQRGYVVLDNKDITVSYYAAELEKSLVEGSPTLTGSYVHQDLMSLENTFGPPVLTSKNTNLHPLARLYGLRRFVVMAVTNPTQLLTSPTEFCFFRSAINVVAVEVCSTVPIFVQIFDPKWNYFIGMHVEPSLRINFDLVALEKAPAGCLYLSGLLQMFKDKQPRSYERPAVVSVRNTYSMESIKVRIPLWVPFSKLEEGDEETVDLSRIEFTALPFGYLPDSCTELHVEYTWPEVADNILMDSELRSDFVPSKAPCGSLYEVAHADSYLSSCVSDFIKLEGVTQSLEYFVGRNFSGVASAADAPNPLDQLTESPSIPMKHNRKYESKQKTAVKRLPGPMNENELNEMLQYLFPEQRTNYVPLYPYAKLRLEEFDTMRIKSAFPDSLVCRLSCLLATCNAHFGGMNGIAQLWASFTRELRQYVDNCIEIPGVAPGFPDTRTCLLHQKLQMLNLCMERRKRRECGRKSQEKLTGDALNQSDDEEEFYDCDTYDKQHQQKEAEEGEEEEDAKVEKEEQEKKEEQKEKDTKEEQKHKEEKEEKDLKSEPADTALKALNKPEGRQKRLSNLKLLHSDEPLFIPVTQDPVPKTEDQLHDDAEVMLKLGPGSGLTTQMMCSSLLSDMEAFKAANPQAVMEDFIRWYSPKDWELTFDDNGEAVAQLSARMLAPGNTWQTVWNQAKPVPACRQKRLFDDTNESLKVLNYLETRTIGEIYELTLMPLLHSAVLKLKDIFSYFSARDLFTAQLDAILADICRLSRDIEISGHNEIGNGPNPGPILEKIKALELQFYHFMCFTSMFGVEYSIKKDAIHAKFREALQNGGSCSIVPGCGAEELPEAGKGAWDVDPDGGLLCPSFKDEMRDKLISKEYVMRVDGETTTTSEGQAGPQFLRAVVTGEKLRLCGAFSENTTFV